MSYKIELPDIEMMFKLVDTISDLTYERSMLDLDIKFSESEIAKIATTNPDYFQGGKPPSMAYIDATWKVTGFNGELKEKRARLAGISAKLEETKLKFQLYKEIIDLYRTQSANERSQIV